MLINENILHKYIAEKKYAYQSVIQLYFPVIPTLWKIWKNIFIFNR